MTRRMDLTQLDAIDVHVHVEQDANGRFSLDDSLLRTKVLFGSDFPVLAPERWLADFEALAIKPEVRPMILKENAVRMLGLA